MPIARIHRQLSMAICLDALCIFIATFCRLGLSLDVIPAPFNAQYLGPFGRAGLVCGDLIMDINGTNVASPNGRRTFKKGGTRVEVRQGRWVLANMVVNVYRGTL